MFKYNIFVLFFLIPAVLWGQNLAESSALSNEGESLESIYEKSYEDNLECSNAFFEINETLKAKQEIEVNTIVYYPLNVKCKKKKKVISKNSSNIKVRILPPIFAKIKLPCRRTEDEITSMLKSVYLPFANSNRELKFDISFDCSLDTNAGTILKEKKTIFANTERKIVKAEKVITIGNQTIALAPWSPSYNTRRVTTEIRKYYVIPYLGLSAKKFSQSTTISESFESVFGLDIRALLFGPSINLDFTIEGSAVNFSIKGEEGIKYINSELRVGYAFSTIEEPWRLLVMVGLNYNRMTGTKGAFGYEDTLFAQFYPEVRKLFSNGHTLAFLGKFSSTGGSLFSLDSQRILGGSLKWGMPLTENYSKWGILSLNYLSTKITSDNAENINLSSLSLNFGIGF